MSLSALFRCPRFVLLHTIDGQGLLTVVDRFKLPDDTIITIRDCSKNTNVLIHSIELDYNKSIYKIANIYHSPKILYNQAFFKIFDKHDFLIGDANIFNKNRRKMLFDWLQNSNYANYLNFDTFRHHTTLKFTPCDIAVSNRPVQVSPIRFKDGKEFIPGDHLSFIVSCDLFPRNSFKSSSLKRKSFDYTKVSELDIERLWSSFPNSPKLQFVIKALKQLVSQCISTIHLSPQEQQNLPHDINLYWKKQ